MKIKALILILTVFSVVICQETTDNSNNSTDVDLDTEDEGINYKNFDNFRNANKKSYGSIYELEARYNQFKKNTKRMKKYKGKNHKVGVTQFSDMSQKEFKRQYLNFEVTIVEEANSKIDGVEFKEETIRNLKNSGRNLATLPTNFDWRDKGYVTSVKNQKTCGSCWAFSAVANIEGQYFKKYAVLNEFAEQQLINCDTINWGCNGGSAGNAFNYLKTTDGLGLRTEAPYLNYKATCKPITGVAKVTGYYYMTTTNEDSIANFLYTTGPLAIAVNADPLQYYVNGILDIENCEADLNHAVLLVGWGEQNGVKYWIAKNTWSTSWGEQGYFRIKRGVGMCGINQYVRSAILA